MDVSRLRELTQQQMKYQHADYARRNGCFPFKGIDTLKDASFGLYYYSVEMDISRLRELTHYFSRLPMLQEPSRNGCFPFKGIETLFHFLFRVFCPQ